MSNSGSKAYAFTSDDVLSSYNDFNNQDSLNIGNDTHSDSANGANSVKEYQNSRTTGMSPANSYNQPEEYPSNDMATVVEGTVKKYTDNLMRFLEGISSRLSQLELYCYNLDKSIGEMRSDLDRDHGEADSKLKSLEKHLQEVHRSVQILRDREELAETQNELSKLQFAEKDSSTRNNSQQSEERAATPVSDSINTENRTSDVNNQQLALVPHQGVAPQPSLPTRPVEQPQSVAPPQAPPLNMTQTQLYYLPTNQLPNPPQHQIQTMHGQFMQSQLAPPTEHSFPQYQQQWPQQLPHQPQPPPQQPAMQPQVRPQSTPSAYSPYPQSQPTHTPSGQVTFPGIPQPIEFHSDTRPYGYGGPGRIAQQQTHLPQQIKPHFVPQSGDGYLPNAKHSTLASGSSYMIYDSEGGRTHHAPPQQPQFQQGGYPSQGPQQSTGTNPIIQNPGQSQFMRNHPYDDIMEKLFNMGYRGDHVNSVIQGMEDSGHAVDFNAVLDRLNANSGGSQRGGWSG